LDRCTIVCQVDPATAADKPTTTTMISTSSREMPCWSDNMRL
jgi:hypothetical protein